MATLNFDATVVKPEEDRPIGAIPAGEYTAMVVSSSYEPSKNPESPNMVLTLEFDVLDEGKQKGRKFWDYFVLAGNEKPTQIGQSRFSSVCHACQKLTVSDSSEIHDIPMKVTLKTKPAQGGYPEGNKVARYKQMSAAPASVTPVAATAAPWES